RFNAFRAFGRFTVSVEIAALSKIIFLSSTLLIPPCAVSVSTPARLREAHRARNNAHVSAKSREYAASIILAILLVAAAGCTPPAQKFVDKIRAEATEKCNQ